MLIGDAAAAVSLLVGEGTGLAMAQAYVLAGQLNRAGEDYRLAYDHYNSCCDRSSKNGKPTPADSPRRSRRKPRPECGYATTPHDCWPSRTSVTV